MFFLEPWMVHEIQEYYRGKNMLAKMMGHDTTTFTDKDVEVIVIED